MSRAYRICVSESVKRHIHVSDGVRTQLELLEVLPSGDMAELLAAELEKRGYERDGDTMRRTDDDGVEITVDLRAGHVTVRLEQEQDVQVSAQRAKRTYEEIEKQTEQALRDQVAKDLERKVDEERSKLTAEVTATLERKLRDLRVELDAAERAVTAEALKTRARQLGEIKEISEDPETGSLTIKVEV